MSSITVILVRNVPQVRKRGRNGFMKTTKAERLQALEEYYASQVTTIPEKRFASDELSFEARWSNTHAMVRRHGGRNLSFRVIQKTPSLADLSNHVDRSHMMQEAPKMDVIRKEKKAIILPQATSESMEREKTNNRLSDYDWRLLPYHTRQDVSTLERELGLSQNAGICHLNIPY